MVKKNPHLLAQSSIDLLLVFGTIIVVLIPLLYYSGQNADIVRERQIADGLLSVRNAVATLLEIGVKSATREIITNPSGITGYNITQNLLNVYFKSQNVSIDFQLPIFAGSKWPITQGIHRMNLYNEGNYIIFTECGNDIWEAYEQCDGAVGGCDWDSGETCIASGTINECKCTCGLGGACPQGYVCDSNDVCQPNGVCSAGYDWINGKCCPDLDDDTFYGTNSACPPPIDCDDTDPSLPDSNVGAEIVHGGAVACFNGVDDDCDSFIDCADADCDSDPACAAGGAVCGDGTPTYDQGEECDDSNLVNGDGCSNTCDIELLYSILPNPQWTNQVARHTIDPTVTTYILNYYNSGFSGLPNPNVRICDNTGCNPTGQGTCIDVSHQICPVTISAGNNQCTETTPAVAGTYSRWACFSTKASLVPMAIQATNTCGNGNLDAGEECEQCSLDADCTSGMCVNGVCASDPQFSVSNCDMNNPGNAMFSNPSRSVADGNGNIYVADTNNNRIKKIYPNGAVITIAGNVAGSTDGSGTTARFNSPSDIEWSSTTNKLYVVDMLNHRIRVIDLNLASTSPNFVTTLAGSSLGFADGVGSAAKFWTPSGLTLDLAGTKVYVADGGNNRIREINLATQAVTTLAGGVQGFADGTGAAAQFFTPRGITVRPTSGGNFLIFVADKNNNRVRRINPTTAVVTTVAGGFTGSGDCNGVPSNTCNDDLDGNVGTMISQFYGPEDIAYSGGWLYIADTGNHRIRRLDVATGNVITAAGISGISGSPPHPGGYANGDARTVAEFKSPMGVAGAIGVNRLYITDRGNHVIRLLNLTIQPPQVSTIAGVPQTQGFIDDHFGYTCGVSGGSNPCDCALCGNNIQEGDEQCDDGNAQSGDGCSSTCATESGSFCGDGTCDPGENCGSCSSDCGCPVGLVCNGGACVPQDPGNEGCLGVCGPGQECGYDSCSASCGLCPADRPVCDGYFCHPFIGICGDGNVDPGEACDPNAVPTGCTAPGEVCDANCQCIPDPFGSGNEVPL